MLIYIIFSKKGVHPIVSVGLLLVVSVLSIVGFQTWNNNFQSALFIDVDSSSSGFSDVRVEGIHNDILYVNSGKNLSILSVKIDNIDCSVNGSFSGLSKIDVSGCLSLANSLTHEILIVTDKGLITSSDYLEEYASGSLFIESNSCYDSAYINTIGNENPCLGMLIVNSTMLEFAVVNNPLSGGLDFYLEFGGQNYTFGDSSYNVFTGQVYTLYFLFFNEANFNSDINYWDVSNVTDMSYVFGRASSFNQSINSWDVSKVTTMSNVFEYASSFNQPLEEWDVSNVTNMNYVFRDASSFNQSINSWDVSKVTMMSRMFYGATIFNQNLSSWDVSSVENMYSMFRASAFNSPLNSWDMSSTGSVEYMFSSSLFNQPLDQWDMSNKVSLRYMFSVSTVFNQDISNWNISSVSNMNGMFSSATVFNQNLFSWDVDQVTSCSVYDNSATAWSAGNKPDFAGQGSPCTP